MEALIKPLTDKLPEKEESNSNGTGGGSKKVRIGGPPTAGISAGGISASQSASVPHEFSATAFHQQLRSGQYQQQSHPMNISVTTSSNQSQMTTTPFMTGFSYGSDPDVMPAMPVTSTAFSPTLSMKNSSTSSPRASEDEDIWNIIDRDFDELMGGGSFPADSILAGDDHTGNHQPQQSSFSALWGSAAAATAAANDARIRPKSIPRQLQGPFGQVPYSSSMHGQQRKGWPEDDIATKLPDDAVEELLDLFFIYMNPILGFMVHEKEFRRTLPIQSPLLLHSMYALAARFSCHPSIAKNPDTMYRAGDIFYANARVYISQNVDVPSLDTVCALIMLMTYASGSGRASASWMYSGMAIRMAQSLKLDLDPDFVEVQNAFGPISLFDKERRRRVWWCCFLTDRYAAAAADRSMLAQERDVKVFYPVPAWDWNKMNVDDKATGQVENGDAAPGVHSQWQLTVLSSTGAMPAPRPDEPYVSQNPTDHYISLGKLFGRVMDYTSALRSPAPSLPGMQVISMADMEGRFTALEQALNDWMANMPKWMRSPGCTFAANWGDRNPDGALSPPSWDVAYIHLLYNTAVILLHRPKMMAALNQGANVTQSKHFLTSQNSAIAAANLTEAMMSANPNLFWITPFVCFCLFQTALVHIVCAQALRGDSAAVAAAHTRLRLHLRALRGTSRFWLQGNQLAIILSDLCKSLDEALIEAADSDVQDMGM
ncbi:fungal-specific transcription factor domain-containing protein [Powellomyces hirtus]|nr:fungal-specific transcription factor domain-containing protein [Powellomyces hirtus]